MQTIRLYSYNNYYNRIVKKESTLSDYGEPLYTKSNHNFIPGDGIRTNIVVNFIAFTKQPNYLIVEDNGSFTHWFITSAKRERGLQYSLDLKRDVLVDYYEDILVHSECIIQKGYINDKYKVLKYTKEQQNYNKVKQNEFLIKDKGGIGYVCGFIESAHSFGNNPIKGTFTDRVVADREYVDINEFRNNFGNQQYFAVGSTNPTSKLNVRRTIEVNFNDVANAYKESISGGSWPRTFKTNIRILNDVYLQGDITYTSSTTTSSIKAATNKSTTGNNTTYAEEFFGNLGNYIASKQPCREIRRLLGQDTTVYDGIKEVWNNKIIKIGSTYYKVEAYEPSSSWSESIISDTIETWQNMIPSSVSNYVTGTTSFWADNQLSVGDVSYRYKESKSYFKLVPQETNAEITIPDNRTHLIDAPYDMFIIPYADNVEYKVGVNTFNASKSLAINMAQAIGQATGSGLYDIQIVPYCPITDAVRDTEINFGASDYTYITNGTDNIGAVIWCPNSSFTTVISESRSEFNPSNIKESIDLDLYRLCSPDSSTQWEFNPVMNDGITEWRIACDYRPYSSYVRVQPKWGGVYANTVDFDSTDIRGLIYNGNYSVTQLNDTWSTYVSNNKNYQAIFDQQISTQIKGYDLQNKAAYDTMFMRSYSTNPLLASFSAWGNMKEQEYNEKTQQINLENQRALYNLNLDNIKAMPNTISKMTSINQDFRIFPYVEYYSCTEEEKQIYRDMIKYNGMSINVTGHIADFLHPSDETFIQATMVRFYAVTTGDESDYDLVQDINRELSLGVYITKE